MEFWKNAEVWPQFSQEILYNWLNSILYVKFAIFHFELNNLLNWIKRTHFELNNILNWITTIIQNWINFWTEFSWNDFESNIELNQFRAKFKHWIESIWVSDMAILGKLSTWTLRAWTIMILSAAFLVLVLAAGYPPPLRWLVHILCQTLSFGIPLPK